MINACIYSIHKHIFLNVNLLLLIINVKLITILPSYDYKLVKSYEFN